MTAKPKLKSKFPHTMFQAGKLVAYRYFYENNVRRKVTKVVERPMVESVADALRFLDDLIKLKQNVSKNGFIEDTNEITFESAANAHFNLKKIKVRKYTLKQERELFERHINPIVGDIPVVLVESRHLQPIIIKLLDEGKFRTIESVKTFLTSFYDYLTKREIVKTSPVPKIAFPKKRFTESLAMTADEAKRFLEFAAEEKFDGWHLIFSLFQFTGCRAEEILGLKWKYVNLQTCEINIREVAQLRLYGETSFEPPKNEKSLRSIPISKEIAETLKIHKDKTKDKTNKFGLVFPSDTGSFQRDNNVLRAMKRILKKASLNDDFSLRTFRHTFATLLLQNGANIKTVSELMGNSPAVLMTRYAHVFKEDKNKIIANLGEILG